jgi:YfiH family protein
VNSEATTLYRSPDGLWRSPLLDAEPWLEHAFGTALARPGGTWRDLKQVHSALVATCDEWREELEADALIASQPGMGVAVKSADCLPILLADPEHGAVAAIHAGWRGCVAGVAIHAVEKLATLIGSRPERLLAAFGPSIRNCCFEVGPEVAQQFSPWFPERNDLDRRTYIDLPEASRRQLVACGLRAGRIASLAPCTVCGGGLADAREFHSWRRDHATGARMHSAIRIKA